MLGKYSIDGEKSPYPAEVVLHYHISEVSINIFMQLCATVEFRIYLPGW